MKKWGILKKTFEIASWSPLRVWCIMYGVNKMVAFVLLIPSVKENIKNKYNFLARYYIFEGK